LRKAFDAKALLDAVEAQRRERNMTWAELAKTVGVSASMMKGMAARAELETDSVLAMTRWLGRAVESFCGDDGAPAIEPGDVASSGRFLRIDTKALHAALDTARAERKLSWSDVAVQIARPEITASTLSGLAGTTRIGLNRLLAITRWLGAPVAAFTRLTPR